MSFWTDLRLPCEQELLIGFYDLKGYMRFAEASEPSHVLELMTGYFALTAKIVQGASGRLIKTMGDAGLVAAPVPLLNGRRFAAEVGIGQTDFRLRRCHGTDGLPA